MPFTVESTYVWLALASALAILEICTPNIVCIWFIAGSMCAFLTSFVTDSIIVQGLVFSFTTGICLGFTKPMADKMLGKKPEPTNADMLIGKHCMVTEDIYPDKKGRVKADGIYWMAKSNTTIKSGTIVQILEMSGATLTVEPVTVENM